ncbi:glycine zipper family protein [Tenacibaculum sp. XPcli2-G]|uniref:glycine zipper family protein n=1 Tax=Tenacibaculum sp. XPcli2-G TaxID=2954503 RepID=UPI0020980939|nr:glycine zipper family protein [Tenacibaculum sp. XPcli2-G]MCO7185320.1 glycine zipper family protein [Tenacibaculum sp. XPcli2-G]
MKKLQYLSISFMLFIALTSFYNCQSKEDDSLMIDTSTNYEELRNDLKNYTNNFKEVFKSEESIKNEIKKHLRTNKTYLNKSYDDTEIDAHIEIIEVNEDLDKVYVELSNHYDNLTETFLLDYYNELSNSYDHELLDVIKKHQNKLNSSTLSANNKNEIQLILDGSLMALKNLEDIYMQNKRLSSKGGFWNCMRQTGGKKIGRGMVAGALRGGYVGLAGGPLGVAVGAAKGAVVGALFGAFWAAADCLPAIQESTEMQKAVLTESDFMKSEDFILSKETLLLLASTNLIIEKQGN